jgi:hypothetical protein
MPQAIVFIAVAIGDAAANAAIYVGASTAVALAVGAVVTSVVTVGLGLGISTLASLAFAPGVPKPPAIQNPIKQSVPPRRSGYGRAKLSGFYMCFEAANQTSYDALAVHDGEVDGWETYYLNDDVVTLTGGGGVISPDGKKYTYGTPGDRVLFQTTTGQATETANTALVAGLPGVWTSDHRGDGVASIYLICKQSKPSLQQQVFPNGLPQPAVAGRLLKVFDPRDPDQDPAVPATWRWNENGVTQLADYLVSDAHGMGLGYARRIAPALDIWKAEADVCVEAVALAAGGTEARYRSGGVFDHTTAPADVINQMLLSFDGWLSQRGDGSIIVRAGHYTEPTVTLTDDHIVGYSLQHFQIDESAVNELTVSFTNPATGFNTDDAGVWQNADDITARGRIRSQPLDLLWVPSASQARRLAKRQMARYVAELRGTLRTNLFGMNALGERYLRVQVSENDSLNDVVIEVLKVEIDLASLTLSIDFVAANPDIDAWSTTEEVDGGEINPRPAGGALDPPVIDDIVVVYRTTGPGVAGARLSLAIDDPGREDLEWRVRWRVAGDSAWTEASYTDVDPGVSVEIDTGFVPVDSDLEVQAMYSTAGGISPWSDTFDVSTPTDATAPDAAAGIMLNSWSTSISVQTDAIPRARSYEWKVYEDDGTTLIGTFSTAVPQWAYTASQAAQDGVLRSYVITVAGVNAAGAGATATTGVISNAAPATIVVGSVTGGTTGDIPFTAGPEADINGYVLFYSATSGFDPLTAGTPVTIGVSPFTLYGLASATYYFRLAAFDGWTGNPAFLNLSAEGTFTITGSSTPPSGGGGGGGGGGYVGRGGGDFSEFF